MSETTGHLLERTSPFGERFVGRCSLCGAGGLRPADALKPCPNPEGFTQDEALLAALYKPANGTEAP